MTDEPREETRPEEEEDVEAHSPLSDPVPDKHALDEDDVEAHRLGAPVPAPTNDPLP